MDKGKSDLILQYKLETEFVRGGVRHTGWVGGAKDKEGKVKEEWDDCGELGSGGFGVVYRQIQRATGNYRAVKAIPKRQVSTLDCSREVLVMAKLAKYPSLFVKFLGWYEDLETMYIAMEYLEEGDLTKHIRAPLLQETVQNILRQILEGLEVMHRHGIAHRDIKPANIFVVSMSPVRVKLGDFGASKCINAPATTTLRTQVSTPSYGAPEVLGLDPNGTELFVSVHQVSCYLIHKRPFLEGKLKQLPTPTDDAGTSLLKSMLSIEPRDRPTAAEALNNAWLMGLKSGGEYRGGNEGGTTQSPNERTPDGKCETRLAPDSKSKKRSERVPPTLDDTWCTPGYLGSAVDQESQIGISTESSESHLGHQKSEPMSHHIQTPYSKGPKAQRKKQVCDIPPKCPQHFPQPIYQHLTSAGEIVPNLPQRQLAWPSTPRGGDIGPRRDQPLRLATNETTEAERPETAPPSIHCTVLTLGETLILVMILAGILMMPL